MMALLTSEATSGFLRSTSIADQPKETTIDHIGPERCRIWLAAFLSVLLTAIESYIGLLRIESQRRAAECSASLLNQQPYLKTLKHARYCYDAVSPTVIPSVDGRVKIPFP